MSTVLASLQESGPDIRTCHASLESHRNPRDVTSKNSPDLLVRKIAFIIPEVRSVHIFDFSILCMFFQHLKHNDRGQVLINQTLLLV